MGTLTRYILRQLVVTTLFVTAVLVLAVWLSQSLRFVDFIVNRGLPPGDFLVFLGLLLPGFLGLVLPIAAFVAVLFIYNKLGNESELSVMRAAGLSHLQLAKPALILAALTTLVAYAIHLYALPASFRAFKDMQYEIRHDLSTVLLQEGVFNTVSDQLTVYVRERGPDGELYGILVHDSRDGEPVTMMATRGALVRSADGPRVVLADGNRQEVDAESGRLSMLHFDRYTIDLDQEEHPVQARWREPKERFLPELLNIEGHRDETYRHELIAEAHNRITAPAYTVAFIAVGLAAMLRGEFSRRGQTMRIVAGVAAVALLQSAQLAVTDLTVRNTAMWPLMYAAAALALIAPFVVLLRRPRRRRAQAPPPPAEAAPEPAP